MTEKEIIFKNSKYTIYKEPDDPRYWIEYDNGWKVQSMIIYTHNYPIHPDAQIYGLDDPYALPKYIHKELEKIAVKEIIKHNQNFDDGR